MTENEAKRRQKMCGCMPGYSCYLHNECNVAEPREVGKAKPLDGAWEQPKQKVQCRICSCEGVDDTVLCRDHLEGFLYARKLLIETKHESIARLLVIAINQHKKG